MAEKKITESAPLSPSAYFQMLKDKSFEDYEIDIIDIYTDDDILSGVLIGDAL